MKIEKLSDQDKQFLENFTDVQKLSMSLTQLKSFANLPKWDQLRRIEAAENQLTGSSLAELQQFSGSLQVLKLANNRIANIDEIVHLTSFKKLENLDLVENPITKVDGYRQKIFEKLPQLKVLDGRDQDDNSVQSSDEDEYGAEYGEEGEFDLDGKNFDSDDDGDDDGFGDFGEEGEDDFDEDDESEEVPAPSAKRQKK